MKRIQTAFMIVLVVFLTNTTLCVAEQSTYQSYLEMTESLKSLATQYKHVELKSLGKTSQNRDIWLLTVAEGNPSKKPALLVLGNLNASLIAGSELCFRMAEKVSQSQYFEKIRDRFTIYFIPRPTPDATELFFKSPLVLREENERRVDDDRDGDINEDGPEDLNGDGLITWMRVEDKAGEWMTYQDDPRIMIKADPHKNEKGQFRLIKTEGIDNDKDEKFNEDGPGGVDFNKNFTFDYPYFELGAGPHQVSEQETRAIADFAFSKDHIFAVFSFSNDDNLNHPWKDDKKLEANKEKTRILVDDKKYVDYLAKKYSEFRKDKGAPSPSNGKGSLVRWAYYHYGRWSFSARPWWVKDDTTEKKKKSDLEKRAEKELNLLNYLDENKLSGFTDWQEIDHPNFPNEKVEVGGFHPYVGLNPPLKEIDQLTEQHTKFIMTLFKFAPQIKISKVEVNALGEDHYRIEVEVQNEGFLPSLSKMGEVNRIPRPLQLHLRLPKETEWIKGYARTLIGRLNGSGGKSKHSFLIHTKAKDLEIELESPITGSTFRKIELK